MAKKVGLILVMGACFLFIIQQTGFLPPHTPNSSYNADTATNTEELPSLTIFHVGGRAAGGTPGGSGYTEYATSEYSNTNPWTEDTQLSTLPVFRNPLEYNEKMEVINVDYDAMQNRLLHAVRSLGFDPDQLEIKDMGYGLSTKAGNINIGVRTNLSTHISVPYTSEISGIPLPAKYDISPQASEEARQKTAKYLSRTYKKLMNMKKPKFKMDNFGFSQKNVIWFYEADGDLTEQIGNYSFNNVRFYGNEDGLLSGINIHQYDLSQKIGDYPVISLDEAKELLVAGYYYGGNAPNYWSGPGEFPKSYFLGLEHVQKVELLYLPDHSHNIYLPYYAFYVDSCYYVPAIEPQYITNMPVNGEFPEVE